MKSLKIATINKQGEIVGEETVNLKPVEAKNPAFILAQAVRVFLSNQRRARAKVKTRAEVRGSNIKIWRQKGTGRARHGARKAPIFVGGGVVHGPTGGQNYRRELNQKMAQKALLISLLEKINGKKLLLAKDFDFQKTKDAFVYTQKVRENLAKEGKIAFLLGKEDQARRFLRNLSQVTILGAESLNPYSLLKTDFLIVSQNALKSLEKYFGVKVEGRTNARRH